MGAENGDLSGVVPGQVVEAAVVRLEPSSLQGDKTFERPQPEGRAARWVVNDGMVEICVAGMQ